MSKNYTMVTLAYALGRGEVDANGLLLSLLDERPQFVLDMANRVVTSSVEAEVMRIYDSVDPIGGNTYIAAIKYMRQATGLGLKEAKDAVDQIVGRG